MSRSGRPGGECGACLGSVGWTGGMPWQEVGRRASMGPTHLAWMWVGFSMRENRVSADLRELKIGGIVVARTAYFGQSMKKVESFLLNLRNENCGWDAVLNKLGLQYRQTDAACNSDEKLAPRAKFVPTVEGIYYGCDPDFIPDSSRPSTPARCLNLNG
eukprot:scaffold37610_cov66-Phaeocystis_antarctica.AAC.1